MIIVILSLIIIHRMYIPAHHHHADHPDHPDYPDYHPGYPDYQAVPLERNRCAKQE